MQASDIGLLMMGVIAVLGTVISVLDHRGQSGPAPRINTPAKKSTEEEHGNLS